MVERCIALLRRAPMCAWPSCPTTPCAASASSSFMRSNEELMAEARVYCDEHTTDAALSACEEEDLRSV